MRYDSTRSGLVEAGCLVECDGPGSTDYRSPQGEVGKDLGKMGATKKRVRSTMADSWDERPSTGDCGVTTFAYRERYM